MALYAAVSILFSTVPALNPGGYNATHWVNMLVASSSPYPTNWVTFPRVEDFTKNPEIYALPMLLYRYVAHWLPSAVKASGSGCRFGSEHHAAAAVRESPRGFVRPSWPSVCAFWNI